MSRPGVLLAICMASAFATQVSSDASGGALSAEPGSPKTQVTVGVADFEQVAPPGTDMSDVASLLAEGLRARETLRVVGPATLGVPALAHPTDGQVREWAHASGADVIVTGRATRLGRTTSVDVRLRDAGTGGVVATLVEEAQGPGALPESLDRLATRIVTKIGEMPAASASPGQLGSNETPPPDAAGREGDRRPAGLPLRSDVPISIRADELEAFEEAGGRRLFFSRNVRVSQEDVTLEAQRLEAFYPRGSSEPERLVARGEVVVTAQPDRRMLCDEATYFRTDEKVLCQGHAELQQGSDRVRGGEIEIFLTSGRLRVRGGAEVRVEPEATARSGGPSGGRVP